MSRAVFEEFEQMMKKREENIKKRELIEGTTSRNFDGKVVKFSLRHKQHFFLMLRGMIDNTNFTQSDYNLIMQIDSAYFRCLLDEFIGSCTAEYKAHVNWYYHGLASDRCSRDVPTYCVVCVLDDLNRSKLGIKYSAMNCVQFMSAKDMQLRMQNPLNYCGACSMPLWRLSVNKNPDALNHFGMLGNDVPTYVFRGLDSDSRIASLDDDDDGYSNEAVVPQWETSVDDDDDDDDGADAIGDDSQAAAVAPAPMDAENQQKLAQDREKQEQAKEQ